MSSRGRDRGRGRGGFSSNDFPHPHESTSVSDAQQFASNDVENARRSLQNLSLARVEQRNTVPRFSSPDEIVTFTIGTGSTHKIFNVHKQFACANSPVLNTAFNSTFQEGTTQTYTLVDVEPSTFRLFVEYLYCEKVTFICHNVDEAEDTSPNGADDHMRFCVAEDREAVKLWVLAGRLLVPRLQNIVFDHLDFASWRCGPLTQSAAKYVYDNTTTGSQLRNFVANKLAWSAHTPDEDDIDSMHPEMLADLVRIYRKASASGFRERQANRVYAADYYVAIEEE